MRPLVRLTQTLDIVVKLLHVLKAAIYGCEAHESHLVDTAQLLHHQFANRTRGNLALALHSQLVADAAYGLVNGFRSHRPFFQRARHACAHLGGVESFPATIALDDERHEQFGGLERGETLTTTQTFATATN